MSRIELHSKEDFYHLVKHAILNVQEVLNGKYTFDRSKMNAMENNCMDLSCFLTSEKVATLFAYERNGFTLRSAMGDIGIHPIDEKLIYDELKDYLSLRRN